MRDQRTGQFLPGHKRLSPGRPPKEYERRYLRILRSEVSDEDFKLICRKAKKQALQGNRWARDWISDRFLGPISQYANIAVSGEHKVLAVLIESLIGAEDGEYEATMADVETEEDSI